MLRYNVCLFTADLWWQKKMHFQIPLGMDKMIIVIHENIAHNLLSVMCFGWSGIDSNIKCIAWIIWSIEYCGMIIIKAISFQDEKWAQRLKWISCCVW